MTDGAKDKEVFDVVGVEEGEAEVGLVFTWDRTAEVSVLEVYFYAVVLSIWFKLGN